MNAAFDRSRTAIVFRVFSQRGLDILRTPPWTFFFGRLRGPPPTTCGPKINRRKTAPKGAENGKCSESPGEGKRLRRVSGGPVERRPRGPTSRSPKASRGPPPGIPNPRCRPSARRPGSRDSAAIPAWTNVSEPASGREEPGSQADRHCGLPRPTDRAGGLRDRPTSRISRRPRGRDRRRPACRGRGSGSSAPRPPPDRRRPVRS